MGCNNCEILRRRISPLEDKAFTEEYRAVEPLDYYRSSPTKRVGQAAYAIRLADTWRAAFGTEPMVGELTKLGRTLKALGWERSERMGRAFFIMTNEDFRRIYG